MILDLRLPTGWTQRHLVVPGEPIEAGAGLAGGAPADSAVAALPPALADLTSGWLIVPPIEEAEDRSFEPAGAFTFARGPYQKLNRTRPVAAKVWLMLLLANVSSST